jgi:ABC-type branched-subunit amino acid transport system substrate-binding protein
VAYKKECQVLPSTGVLLNIILLILPLIVVAETTIDIGISTALSGPAKSLGIAVSTGIELHFAEVNQAGGIHNRRLRLIPLDDGYHPADAARQMDALINRHHVLAVIGNLGTPTAEATIPIAEKYKTLLFGAVTGASLLRPTPPYRYVINLRASYDEEMVKIVETILRFGINPHEISFFVQNDSYGEAGYQGAVKALRDKGYKRAEQLPRSSYLRNTMQVEDALLSLMQESIESRAIIIVGTSMPAAKFISLAKDLLPGVRFFCISLVGTQTLARTLSNDIQDVYISEVAPPLHSQFPLIEAYHKALAIYAPKLPPSSLSLEGYIAARVLVEGIRRAGPNVTRERLVNAMESLNEFDIGLGVPLYLSKEDHQASHHVWLSAIEYGKVIHVSNILLEKLVSGVEPKFPDSTVPP